MRSGEGLYFKFCCLTRIKHASTDFLIIKVPFHLLKKERFSLGWEAGGINWPHNRKFIFLTGHRTRSDERDQANAYDQFHSFDHLGFEGLRRSIRDNGFPPFTELHPGPLQPVKLPADASSAFSALAPGKLAAIYFLLNIFLQICGGERRIKG